MAEWQKDGTYPEFRRSERQFRHYQEAQQWLEKSLVLAM